MDSLLPYRQCDCGSVHADPATRSSTTISGGGLSVATISAFPPLMHRMHSLLRHGRAVFLWILTIRSKSPRDHRAGSALLTSLQLQATTMFNETKGASQYEH